MKHDKEAIKTFSADAANKRVGWVSVRPGNNEPFVAVDVVTATVLGEDGVEVGLQYWIDNEGNRRGAYSYQQGLGHVAAFSALLSPALHWQEEFSMYYRAEGMKHAFGKEEPAELLLKGTRDNRLTDDAPRTWAVGQDAVLDEVHRQINDSRIVGAYGQVYYLINGSIGRYQPEETALAKVPVESLLMPDALMVEETQQQLQAARAISTALSAATANNLRMRGQLTRQLEDIPMTDIPDLFIASRRQAADLEKDVQAAAAKLKVRRLAYVPVGQGKNRRSWPYMDATADDERTAFGLELDELRARNIDRTVIEIDREQRELDARIELANEAINRLSVLSLLEQRKAE